MASFPFYLIKDADLTIFKLLRLFKLTRILGLFDLNRFQKLAKILTGSSSRVTKIKAQLSVKSIYKVFKLIMMTILITYFTGVLWIYFMMDNLNTDKNKEDRATFLHVYEIDTPSEPDEVYRLIMVMYFSITTLSTVGYGDFTPQSNVDKILIVCLQLAGIVFFSYVLGSFI